MKLILSPALSFAFAFSVQTAQPASWPAFRGDNSSGVSDSAKLPEKFGPGDNVAWIADVPWAPSSPCVWEEKIFVTTFAKNKLETRAYDQAGGKLLWTQAAPSENIEEFHATEGSPAASTPVTDGRHVVSYFGSAGLFCYDFEGKELWRVLLPTVASAGSFGTGGSPHHRGRTCPRSPRPGHRFDLAGHRCQNRPETLGRNAVRRHAGLRHTDHLEN